MRFISYTDQELLEMKLLPPGDYEFEVLESKDRVSKNGAEMIELKVCLFDTVSGKQSNVFDYLLESMAFKLKHFCDACGLSQKYIDGNLQAIDCMGKRGFATVFIQKDKTGQYQDKNAIKDYIISDKIDKNPIENNEKLNDDLPF